MGTMTNRMIVACAVLMAGAVSFSCTVKENRVPCPCYLEVLFPERDVISHGVDVGGWNSKFVFSENIDLSEYPEAYVRAVERQSLIVSAFTGRDGAEPKGRRLEIPFGSQCDSLYAFYREVDCSGEKATCEVLFRKQFATVNLDIRKSVAEMEKYSVKVSSNSCGFDLLSFVPLLGPFECTATAMKNDYAFRFRVPRQSDNSMTVILYKNDNHMGEYALGKLIERTGYDWLDDDLKDIYVTIDHVSATLFLRIEGWEYVEEFPLREVTL